MEEQAIWGILRRNIKQLSRDIVSLQKGTWVDIYYDEASRMVQVGSPASPASVRIARMTGLSDDDLESCYAVRRKNDHYETDEGEAIPKDAFPDYLAQQIGDMCDGGAEWGWEFKICGEGLS